MDAPLRTELTCIVESILRQTSATHLGFYLHGSQWSGAAGQGSDIDILGLLGDPLTEDEFEGMRALEREIVGTSGLPIDLHIHRLEVFARDQYVDLRNAAEFLGGADVRDRLPERSFDDACHEAIAIACQVLQGGAVSEHTGWKASAKEMGYLASALLAASEGYAATGAHDAAERLMELDPEFGTAVHAHVTMQKQDDTVRPEMQRRTREALRNPAQVFGPRCRATIEAYRRR